MKRQFITGLAVLVAAIAAIVVPAGSASAAFPPPPKCWVEADTWVTGATVHATAYKDCTDGPPQNLSLTLETQVCDAGGCLWAAWKSGSGYVSYTVSDHYVWFFRSSRLRSKVVTVDVD